ncbi:MAG: Cof-type HAD-IIB family hydrolase, partial [Streptococcaceae bacterium]|nr:Cof-type HAD-IIB family hydrolase [Streptococcaceae bacterium]
SQSLITPRTTKTLNELKNRGHLVVIATGRPYRLALPFYEQLGLNTPMVNFNGGLVTFPNKKWKSEHQAEINKDIVLEIVKKKSDYQLSFVSAENKEKFFVDNFKHFEPTFFGATTFQKENLLTEENLTIQPSSILVKVNDIEKKLSVTDNLRNDFGEFLEVNPWGGPEPILELLPKGVHKSSGIERIKKEYDINRKDVIAVGDEYNDIEMLKSAGLGVAMKNASDEVKKYANQVTSRTNDDEGLSRFLEEFFSL